LENSLLRIMHKGLGVFGLKAFLLLATILLCATAAWAESDIITGGIRHTAVIKSDGTLWTWGYNAYGQLGDGTTASRTYPAQVGSATDWAEVAAGGYFTVAIKTDGTLWAWGQNTYGQLGTGSTVNRKIPVQVGTDTDWASVAAGAYHTMALKTDGTLWAWGQNTYGQLGDGTNANSTSPVQIGADADWASVTAGWAHSLSVKAGGTLWAWGRNIYGQIGIGNTVDQNAPVQVGEDEDWAEASAGNFHSLALKTGGTIWAWGSNVFGQLGDGTSLDSSSPVQAGSAANWSSVAAGGDHSLAIKATGTLWAWGKNNNGQLGDGSTFNRAAPVRIGTDTAWSEISGAYNHSVALKTGNSLWTWGRNADGQIGNNSRVNKTSPLRIREDLRISDLAAPDISGSGRTVSVIDTTKNIGIETAANSSQTCFYLSTDSVLGGDFSLGCRTASVGILAAGAFDTQSTSLTMPSVTTGIYYIIAKADNSNTVTETNEANNKRSRVIRMGPDLAISALSAPPVAGAGEVITINDTTKNKGGGPAGSTSSTCFYLSSDTVLGGDSSLGCRAAPVPNLTSAASSIASTDVTIPSVSTGTYYVIAKADDGNAVTETIETNNTMASAAIAIGPDLSVSSLSAPLTAGAGSDITVSDTTSNTGGGSTGVTTSTALYFSTDSILDGADVLIGSRPVGNISAGASNASDSSVTIPPGTPTGTYYIIANADDGDAVSETVETNNTKASMAISIGSDLIVWSLTAPSAASAGSTIAVSDTTWNNGGGSTGTTTSTAVYLSSNGVLDGGDTLLGARTVPVLEAGLSDSASTNLNIPGGTAPGTYYIIAKADDGSTVSETSETNNTKVSAAMAIGPDLVVSALTAPPSTVAGSTITVSDTTSNSGGGSTGTETSTAFYLSSNGVLDGGDTLLGARTVPALEAGLSDSASTSLTIPGGTAPGTYYIIAKADSGSAVSEASETNNTKVSAAMAIGPDLVVSALTAPATAGAGFTMTVSDTTTNNGGGPTGTATSTAFYLSPNTVLDGGDTLLGARTVPALEAGLSDSASTSLNVPAGTATGIYYIIAKADDGSAVTETSETNNTRVSATIRVGPDLIVSLLTAPSTAGAGFTINISDTTSNIGGGTTGTTTSTVFYLSSDTVLDGGDFLLGGRTVPALGPGLSDSVSTSLTIPAGTATGIYYIIAKADDGSAVTETSETNNTRVSAPVKVGPDLIVSALAAPSPVGAGATITVTDTAWNIGGGSTGTATSTAFYLSPDNILDGGDIFLASRTVPPLGPGDTSSASTSLNIPGGTVTGIYYIIAKADNGSAVTETSETNNTRAFSIKVGPDLAVSAFAAPSTAGAGSTITVSDTTLNIQGSTGASTSTAFYLSSDTILAGGDIFLASRTVPPLGPGDTSSASTSLNIPGGTVTGTYYIIAKADNGEAVSETSETNNTRYVTIKVGPDLLVSALSAPSTAGAGLTMAVSDTTLNIDGSTGTTTSTAFYLSFDGVLDGGDTLLGARTVQALGPGVSDSASTSLTIPAGTATGTYYVIAKADNGEVVTETSETNNTRVSAAVRIGPDLLLSALSAPSTAATGSTINVSDTTANIGGGSTGTATSTAFYLSTDSVLDGGDSLLARRTVPALGPGEASPASTSVPVPLPGSTATGTFYIIARADDGNAVPETSETNNTRYTVITVTAP
jgi:alpha-tubulin suppressor-like RCC1 family protein/subtilase family serine protease